VNIQIHNTRRVTIRDVHRAFHVGGMDDKDKLALAQSRMDQLQRLQAHDEHCRWQPLSSVLVRWADDLSTHPQLVLAPKPPEFPEAGFEWFHASVTRFVRIALETDEAKAMLILKEAVAVSDAFEKKVGKRMLNDESVGYIMLLIDPPRSSAAA